MEDFDIIWQDAVATAAGLWLMLAMAIEIDSMTIADGWVAYTGGAAAAMFASAGFTSKNPLFAWAAAAMGVLNILTPLILGFADSTLVLVSMVAGGAVLAVLSAWSAVIKKGQQADA